MKDHRDEEPEGADDHHHPVCMIGESFDVYGKNSIHQRPEDENRDDDQLTSILTSNPSSVKSLIR
jgi:hypothetical protein